MDRKEFLKYRRQYGKISASIGKYLKCNICQATFKVTWAVGRHKRRYNHFDEIEKNFLLMAEVTFEAVKPTLIKNIFQPNPLFKLLSGNHI